MGPLTGIICLWSGLLSDIPAGWHLCDGTEGTPDLRARFIVGAGGTYNPFDTGGSEEHNHTVTNDSHGHDLETGNNILDAVGTGDYSISTTNMILGGITSVINHLPPWYALCYIMKL